MVTLYVLIGFVDVLWMFCIPGIVAETTIEESDIQVLPEVEALRVVWSLPKSMASNAYQITITVFQRKWSRETTADGANGELRIERLKPCNFHKLTITVKILPFSRSLTFYRCGTPLFAVLGPVVQPHVMSLDPSTDQVISWRRPRGVGKSCHVRYDVYVMKNDLLYRHMQFASPGSFLVTNLLANTRYEYMVQPVWGMFRSLASHTFGAVTSSGIRSPAIPSNLQIIPGIENLTLKWYVVPQSRPSIKSYRIRVGERVMRLLDPSQSNYTMTSLVACAHYHVTLQTIGHDDEKSKLLHLCGIPLPPIGNCSRVM